MKKVLSKSQVAHFWANQTQNEGRVSGGNFYFEGKTIYSYGSHFPIACISDTPGTVLMTTRTYSNTTAHHLSEVRQATSHKTKVYCHDPKEALNGRHAENINKFEQEAKNISYKLPKSTKPAIYLDQISQQKALLMAYVEFFGLKQKAYKHLHYINIVTKDGAIKATEQERKEIAKRDKEREKRQAIEKAEQLEKDKKELAKWRKRALGYDTTRSLYLYALEGTFLRFNKASQEVETSKGVQIPVKVAERFYKWLKHQLLKGGCNGECEHKILDYSVDYVNETGIKVGCHNIEWSEINTIAKKLGWK